MVSVTAVRKNDDRLFDATRDASGYLRKWKKAKPVKYLDFYADRGTKRLANYFKCNARNISMESRRTPGETARVVRKINFFHSKD